MLNLSSAREANNVVNTVTDSIVAEITANIDTDRFTLKLPRFGQIRSSPQAGQDAQDSSHRQDASDCRQAQGEIHPAGEVPGT